MLPTMLLPGLEEEPHTRRKSVLTQAGKVHTIKVTEGGQMELGPFGKGVVVTITSASYGAGPGRSKEVTGTIRDMYSPSKGLRLNKFNEHFGDPAPLTLKTLTIEYSLSKAATDATIDASTRSLLLAIGQAAAEIEQESPMAL